jgi:hypothetical protein
LENVIVSNKTRWLAAFTGCLTSVAGIALGLSLGFAFLASILIIGAVIQPKFRRAGRGLICAGALLLSFVVFDIGSFMRVERHAGSGMIMVKAASQRVLFETITFSNTPAR